MSTIIPKTNDPLELEYEIRRILKNPEKLEQIRSAAKINAPDNAAEIIIREIL